MSRIYLVRAATDATDAEIIQTAEDAQATINALTIERDAPLQRVAKLNFNVDAHEASVLEENLRTAQVLNATHLKSIEALRGEIESLKEKLAASELLHNDVVQMLYNTQSELRRTQEDKEQLEKDNAELREGHDATALKLSAAQERNRELKSTLMKIDDLLDE